MTINDILTYYAESSKLNELKQALQTDDTKLHLKGLNRGALSFYLSAYAFKFRGTHLLILHDKEEAVYVFNDLCTMAGDHYLPVFFPASYKVPYHAESVDQGHIQMRAEVLNLLNSRQQRKVVITYPEALAERVIERSALRENTLLIEKHQSYSLDFINELLIEYGFHKVDYVYEPGQFSVRGGIVDVFSFSHDQPYRLEFFGDEVESIRSFNPADQLSIKRYERLEIIPNIVQHLTSENPVSLLDFHSGNMMVWTDELDLILQKTTDYFKQASIQFKQLEDQKKEILPDTLYQQSADLLASLSNQQVIEFGLTPHFSFRQTLLFNTHPQPRFNKNFQLLSENLLANQKNGYRCFVLSEQKNQLLRLERIFKDIGSSELTYESVFSNLSEGFIDGDQKILCYTDHQIFERYHRFYLKEGFSKNKQALTIKELNSLKKGDFVVHIDHGIGRFSGLESIEVNGKMQEAIRLIYKDSDVLYVSIHSLHRISKYAGKEGTIPTVNKLGSQAWQKLKSKTKKRIRELAFDLLKLYAQRKTAKGFAFSPDTYLQTELEASFMFEDTPDQFESTIAIKKDMESEIPMDRLICGDVGFGKTELAVRAALKAAADSKQVVILVPTTVLSFQHYKTFSSRLAEFPVNVDYLNRFKTGKRNTETLKNLEAGKTDIIIGTHKLLGKNVKFKDLGLLIVDEEQKFGVAIKDKLKLLKANIDTLTLTATPIPRTLQFSLMGARDLSLLNTAPPNRYPVQTELMTFNEAQIQEAINYEIARGGQVFFVNNRIQNLDEVAGMIQRLCPDASVITGHGQMHGEQLEKVMLGFMDGQFDVLVSTTIVESGIDIPNANTIIINEAQKFGLSDLHQLRGRVGRSNRKAFCYLITPPLHLINDDSRKRIKALLQFSELGSGMNIAMRDLDIRGAGDLFGAEQSGFISEIGFDMYQKILKEAIHELKEKEYSAAHADSEEAEAMDFVADCVVETDLEIRIPNDYVNEIEERIALYKTLDEIETETDLLRFESEMADRFGKPPKPLVELFDTLRLRWLGKSMGFEKILLKAGKLIGTFVSNQEAPYYQTETFSRVLQFIQKNPPGVKMYERKNQLKLSSDDIISVHSAIAFLNRLTANSQECI